MFVKDRSHKGGRTSAGYTPREKSVPKNVHVRSSEEGGRVHAGRVRGTSCDSPTAWVAFHETTTVQVRNEVKSVSFFPWKLLGKDASPPPAARKAPCPRLTRLTRSKSVAPQLWVLLKAAQNLLATLEFIVATSYYVDVHISSLPLVPGSLSGCLSIF